MGCVLFNTTASMTWEEANNYCQQDENGTLLQIWNELQFDFIRMELGFIYDHVQVGSWWTSGTDAGKEGVWRWAASLVPVGDFIWHSGQPNDGLNGNCLYLTASSFLGYDGRCSTSKLAVICERR